MKAPRGRVVFHNVRITGCSDTAIISEADEDLEIWNSEIVDCKGGAVRKNYRISWMVGTMTKSKIRGTTISDNGGPGILSGMPVDIENSVIARNKGGGVILGANVGTLLTSEQMIAIRSELAKVNHGLRLLSDQKVEILVGLAKEARTPSNFIGHLRAALPEIADVATVASGIYQAILAVLPR